MDDNQDSVLSKFHQTLKSNTDPIAQGRLSQIKKEQPVLTSVLDLLSMLPTNGTATFGGVTFWSVNEILYQLIEFKHARILLSLNYLPIGDNGGPSHYAMNLIDGAVYELPLSVIDPDGLVAAAGYEEPPQSMERVRSEAERRWAHLSDFARDVLEDQL